MESSSQKPADQTLEAPKKESQKKHKKFGNWKTRHALRMGFSTYRGKVVVQSAFVLAAIGVGIVSVYFIKYINYLSQLFQNAYSVHPFWMSIVTPLGFLASTAVCVYFAPQAGGSGVPQALHAASQAKAEGPLENPQLVSTRTSIIKAISTGLGFITGASIGGEGPTVQIAASIFAHLGKRVRRYFPKIDYHSFLVAGAGTGIAAVFNTPLGGIVFALEEVALEGFGKLRHMVMLAIITTGLTAQALVGNDLYFGYPNIIPDGSSEFYLWAVVIGVVGGLCGGLFGRVAASAVFYKRKTSWWVRALVCGIIVSLINLAFHGKTAGSGYEVTRHLMTTAEATKMPLTFPVAKLFATAFSTLSGMGGGILAPSVSIGAWLGVSTAKIASFWHIKACAIFGMVAYFSGAFQIPLTALVIVMEMTNEHELIFPMMIAAFCAYMVGKIVMPESLYHVIIKRNYKKEPEPHSHTT